MNHWSRRNFHSSFTFFFFFFFRLLKKKMCTEFIQLVDSSLPKYPIASTLLNNSNDQQNLLCYISPPVCRCALNKTDVESRKSTDSEKTLLNPVINEEKEKSSK